MLPSPSILLDLGIILAFILILSLLFAKLKLPVIAAEIIAGMIAGPYVLGWVPDSSTINDLSTIGIVLLLFVIGLELDPIDLIKIAQKSLGIFSIEVAMSLVLGLVAALFLGGSLLEVIVVALAISITSTSIVGKLLLSQKNFNNSESQALMGVLVIEDLFAVVALVIVSSITAGGIPSLSESIFHFLVSIIGGLVLTAVGYLVATYLAPTVINYINSFDLDYEEIPFLFSLGLGVAFAIIAQLFGYSPGIGSFVIGLALRGKFSAYVKDRIAPIKELFILVFFFSMGLKINPYPSLPLGLVIIPVILFAVFSKYFGGLVSSRFLLKFRGKDSSRFGVWLIPRGEFSFVIGQLAMGLGILTEKFYSLIGIIVIATSIIGPALLKLFHKGGNSTAGNNTSFD